jgi:hypothetical protein
MYLYRHIMYNLLCTAFFTNVTVFSIEELKSERPTLVFFLAPIPLLRSNHMDRQARTGDTVYIYFSKIRIDQLCL